MKVLFRPGAIAGKEFCFELNDWQCETVEKTVREIETCFFDTFGLKLFFVKSEKGETGENYAIFRSGTDFKYTCFWPMPE